MTQSPHKSWAAFAHPHRFAEAHSALKNDTAAILAARGADFDETALHWAALGDAGLSLDVVAAGIDPNVLDRLQRTPLDWVNDMLWMSIVWGGSKMNNEGKDRLRFKMSKQIPVLWGRGFRPGPAATRHVGEVWIRAGIYELISLLEAELGLDNWGVDDASALHAWALSENDDGHENALKDLLARGLKVDQIDNVGRTPLRYVVEAWAADAIHRRVAAKTVELLLKYGADPLLKDQEGVAPGEVPLLRGLEVKKMDAMARALDKPDI